MNKLFVLAGLALALSTTNLTAQAVVKQKTSNADTKTKIKPTTTVGDKVHNVLSSKHSRSHGWKSKHKNKHTNKKTKVEVKKS